MKSAFRVAVPLCGAALVLVSCVYSIDKEADAPEPCVETHDRGCVLEPEYEALVEDLAVEYAEPSGFQNQWGLDAINADRAYANLELQLGPNARPGEGVTVGVLDTGIDGADPAFRDKTVIERFIAGANDETGDKFSHGTAVAGIIAGEDIPGYPHDAHGVAWGADLVVFAMPLGQAPELVQPDPGKRAAGSGGVFLQRLSTRYSPGGSAPRASTS